MRRACTFSRRCTATSWSGQTADDQESRHDTSCDPETLDNSRSMVCCLRTSFSSLIITHEKDIGASAALLQQCRVIGHYAGLRPATQHRDYCIAADSARAGSRSMASAPRCLRVVGVRGKKERRRKKECDARLLLCTQFPSHTQQNCEYVAELYHATAWRISASVSRDTAFAHQSADMQMLRELMTQHNATHPSPCLQECTMSNGVLSIRPKQRSQPHTTTVCVGKFCSWCLRNGTAFSQR